MAQLLLLLLLSFDIIVINAQSVRQFYSGPFEYQSDWIIENTGADPDDWIVVWEYSDGCNWDNTNNHLCVRMPGGALISRVISTVGYHSLQIYIDNRANGNSETEWCYIEYGSNLASFSRTNLLRYSEKERNIEVPVADADAYNDESSFEIRLGHNGNTGGDNCFFDNLKILGIPYPTTSPTPSPTLVPTKQPTSMPTFSPTKQPTPRPTPSPTPMPTLPTQMPTSSPTLVPTFPPTSRPTSNPTRALIPVPTATSIVPTDFTKDGTISKQSLSNNIYTIIIILLGVLSVIVIILLVFVQNYAKRRTKEARKIEANIESPNNIETNTETNIRTNMDTNIVQSDGPITNGIGQIVNDDDMVAYRRDTFDVLRVKSWFETGIQLPIYYDIFINNGYDTLSVIKEIEDERELESMGIFVKQHRLRIWKGIVKLRIVLEREMKERKHTMGSVRGEGSPAKHVHDTVFGGSYHDHINDGEFIVDETEAGPGITKY